MNVLTLWIIRFTYDRNYVSIIVSTIQTPLTWMTPTELDLLPIVYFNLQHTGATLGRQSAYLSGVPEITLGFCVVRVAQSSVFLCRVVFLIDYLLVTFY